MICSLGGNEGHTNVFFVLKLLGKLAMACLRTHVACKEAIVSDCDLQALN